jgi:sterol 3beta-glucosyltransferase
VSFPIKNGGSFHRLLYIYQRVTSSDDISEVPDDPHIFCASDGTSHPWLLPRCAVALHHGGIGTVLAAARAKVPQLVMPLAFDQPFWGQTLEDLGVATR